VPLANTAESPWYAGAVYSPGVPTAGDLVACGMLGEDLPGGTGTSVDRAKGIALLKKACEGGFDRACKKQGGTR
jgi:TPR repeat protein